MLCPLCQHDAPPAASFCPRCGSPLSLRDPDTDDTASPKSYTPRHLVDKILRSRSALEGERKQVSVLFADVAGFTPLSERLDPEAVHVIMDGCFTILAEQVHRYEGLVNQFTGDGIMALFGAPISHEDHAVRALHAAVGIRDAIKDYGEQVERRWGVPLRLRIGVNTGTVVVGRIGDNLRMDYTAQGDTTNLAARLQQTAPEGAIWVGESTYRIARESFEWRTAQTVELKGKSARVTVHDLVAPRALRSRFEASAQRGLTWFVGRDDELQGLLAAWERGRAGGGQVMSVVGEAGIGKSRLLHEFKQRLEKDRVPYIEGSCFAYGDVISYLPFLGIVKALFGLQAAESETVTKRRIAQRLAELEVNAASCLAYLHNLLSLSVEDELFAKLTPQLVRERTVEALKTLVLACARRQPMVLILEDVHWIDKATKEVVTALVDELATVPLLLVLAYRPEYLHPWTGHARHGQISLVRLPSASSAQMVRAILAKPYAAQVPLQRLSPEESRVMVRDLLGTAARPRGLEEMIASKTDGNPLFVEELTRALLDHGELIQVDDRYLLRTAADKLDLPTTVQGVLLARIDRLDEELKTLVQVAAVIGRVFSYPLLAQVVAPDLDLDLDALLLQLEALDFIYRIAPAPEREYSFKHVLTQQAVYDTLLASRRAELHGRIGNALERLYPDRLEEYYELLAYHYAHSADAERTLLYLDLANQKAVKAFAISEAKGYFDQAMALLDTLPPDEAHQRRRISLLVNQGTVMFLLVKFAEYHEMLTRYAPFVTRMNDPGLLGAYRARLGYCECSLGSLDQAVETLRDAGALCEGAGNAEEAGFAYTLLQWSHLYRGDYREVLALKERVLRMMDQKFNLRWSIYSSNAVAFAHAWLGRWEEAVAEGRAALGLAEEFADSSLTSFAAKTLSIIYLFKGDRPRAIEYATLASEQAHALADKVIAQGTLAWAWCRSGECQRGIEILERGVGILRMGRFRPIEIWNLFTLAEGYFLARELAKARETAVECLQLAEPAGMKFFIGAACRLLAEIALATDDPAAGRAHAERAVDVLRSIGAENDLALAYATCGRVAQRQGAHGPARDYLARSLAMLERLGTIAEPDAVRRELLALTAD